MVRDFMTAIVDTETDQILGAAILGIEGGDGVSVLQMAMMGERYGPGCVTPSSHTRRCQSR